MRGIITWIFTLAAGFAALMAVAILALLPVEAAKNRAIYGVVEQYARTLSAARAVPRNAEVDDAFTATTKGIRIWRSLPGGCADVPFEAPSDSFVLGFWENGSADRFDAIWWHCYAYPSGKTTMQLSVGNYLKGSAGWQIAAYALIASIAGYVAWLLRARGDRRSLASWAKAVWFGAFMTTIPAIYALSDFGDDQFWENAESVKWFVVVCNATLGVLFDKFGFDFFVWFALWSMMGWLAGKVITFGRERLSMSRD